MSDDRPAKRVRVRLACQECRDRKIRCDGGRPICQSCTRKLLGPDQCYYAEPPVEADFGYVRSLESRIRELEQFGSGNLRPTLTGEHQATDDSQTLHLPSAETLDTSQYRPLLSAATISSKRAIQPAPGQAAQLERHHNLAVLQEGTQSHGDQGNPIIASSEASQTADSMRSPDYECADLGGERTFLGGQGRKQPDQQSLEHGDTQSRSIMGVEGLVEDNADTHEGSSVYLGRSSAAALMNEVRTRLLKRRRESMSLDGSITSPDPRSDSRSWTRKFEKDVVDAMQELTFPPRRVADRHLDNYWDYIWPFNPILHRNSFQKRYEELWSQSGFTVLSFQEADGIHSIKAFYGLLNILIALGSLHSKDDSAVSRIRASGETFFDRAEILMCDRSMDHNNLISVQVFILMAHYLHTTGSVNKCWVAVGTAIRIAQGLGIHLCPASHSQAQNQERKRTWSYCLQMDRILGMMFGRQPMVTSSMSGFMPDLTNDDLLSMEPYSSGDPVPKVQKSILGFFVSSMQYSDILLEVLQTLYNHQQNEEKYIKVHHFQPKDYHELLRMDHGLNEWRNQLPGYLHISPHSDLSGPGIQTSQAIAMLCRYLHLKMLVFRPATVGAARSKVLQDDQKSSDGSSISQLQRSLIIGCAHSCASAAQDMIRVIHIRCMNNEHRRPNWWYTTYYVFTAGTVLLAIMASQYAPILLPDTVESFEMTWRQAMEIFAIYEAQGIAFARQCAWSLKTAREQGYREPSSETRPGSHSDGPGSAPNSQENWTQQDARASYVNTSDNLSNGQAQLVDAILSDHWWQTAGLQWIDGIDLAENFVSYDQ